MYLNPDWDENMYGETIFLNQIRDPEYSTNGTVVVDKEYEMFGKVYIFNYFTISGNKTRDNGCFLLDDSAQISQNKVVFSVIN